jgi:pimeloyl-ACP methyl ester carboxylesterase
MLVSLALMVSQAIAPVSDSVVLRTPTGNIQGTLLTPSSPRPIPLVVIIAGSGPTDRDGNSMLLPAKINSLKLLAEGLAANGIASVRYDKRGVAGSVGAMTSEANLRFTMYADDAAGWVTMFRADPRFSSIVIVGHSEGSLLGMLATKSAHADGYVSIAGAGRPAAAVLREQLSKQLPPDLLATANRVLDTLVAGHTADFAPPVLATLFRASVQPYLISWLPLDPAALIAGLTVPILITQGTYDTQVPRGDADLLAKAQPKARLVVIEGMTHVLKKSTGDIASQQATYTDPSLGIARELVDAISAFVKAIPAPRR